MQIEDVKRSCHVTGCGVAGAVKFCVRWPYAYGAVMPTTLERLDGTVPPGRGSTRAELLMGVAPRGGRRRQSAVRSSTTPASDEKLGGDAAGGGCPPTAASVAAACCSVCAVADGAGGCEIAKLGAADGAAPVLTGRSHLSSVMSSVGRQNDMIYASESDVGSPFLMASVTDVCR